MLSAPWVVGPITPCSRFVLVEGLLTRATVRLFRDGTVPIGKTAAQFPFEFVELDSSVELEPGAMITATQELDGEVSEHSPVPYQVLLAPSAEAFERMFFLAPPIQCGTCLSLGGVVPGATVTVELNGNQLPPKVAKWATVMVPVSGGISVGVVPTPITVKQDRLRERPGRRHDISGSAQAGKGSQGGGPPCARLRSAAAGVSAVAAFDRHPTRRLGASRA